MPSTSRLALNKPQSADVVDVTTAISDQMGVLDLAATVQACTSSTRPVTGLFTGKLILETDTKNLLRYTGSTWEVLNNVNYPRGYCGHDYLAGASGDSANGVEVLCTVGGNTLTCTFPAYTGRRYLVTADAGMLSNSGQDVSAVIRSRWAFGSSVTTSGNLINTTDACLNEQAVDADMQKAHLGVFTVNATGTITVGIFYMNTQTSGTETCRMSGRMSLLVEDIGAA